MIITQENSIETFPGSVKYSATDGSTGSIKWKTGSLVVEKDDKNGWRMKMTLACTSSSCLTLPLHSLTLVKHVATDKGVHIEVKRNPGSSPVINIAYQTNNKLHINRLKDLLVRAAKLKCVTPKRLSDKENRLMFDPSINNKHNDTSEKENTAQNFTSVKSHRRDSCEGKENKLSSSKQFLQRSSEKSRQCLSNISSFYGKTSSNPTFSRSTPTYSKSTSTHARNNPTYTSTPSRSFYSGSKRTPGLMPDPTPIKRPRLSDSITYSMKDKPSVAVETNQAPALQGFSNLGNTCYMNAILQCLFGLETLVDDLTSNRKMFRSFQQHSLYHALVKLLCLKRLVNGTDHSRMEALRRVKCAISNTAKRFSGCGQHDAHEFLGQVLDQLKEEVIKVSKATPTPNKDNEGGAVNRLDSASSTFPGQNPITVNFEFEVLHTLSCLQCKEEVTKAEQFHDISLDVPKQKDLLTPRSLQDALTLFFKNEEIEYTCEKCGHGKASVSHKISRLPRIFILHLKRYSYNQTYSKNTKMGRNVKVPYYLTLQQHCTEETVPPYLPVSQEPLSEQKLNQQLVDEYKTDDTPSRRKLEYVGYDFKNPEKENQCDSDSIFTETKQKGEDVSNTITLDYEEDPDFTRAIQMSLQDHHESKKRHQESIEENDSNFEKVMEMSKREQNPENCCRKDKKLQEMSEEEMIQFAIEQSLMESDPYHHDNNSQTDDVINLDDHMYTRNNNGFYDDNECNGGNNSGHENSNTNEQITTSRNNLRKRFKSDSDLEILLNKNVEKLNENDSNIANELKEHDNQDNIFKTTVKSRSKSDSHQNEIVDSWTNGEGQNKMGEEFETCENENINNEQLELADQSSRIENNRNKAEFENVDKKGAGSEDKDKEVELDLDLSCEEVLPDIDDMEEDLNDSASSKNMNNDLTYPNNEMDDMSSDNTKQTEGDNKVKPDNDIAKEDDKDIKDIFEGKEEEDVFTVEDEDDSWLSNVDDKENTMPVTERPTLSDPADFTMDTEHTEGGSDEVDGFVEENLNIPDINNEKGELPYTYRLVSVVSHMGTSSAAGHYISDVFDMKKKCWYSYDDSHVTEISEADVKSKRERSGYIFFYMDKSIYDDVSLNIAINKTASKS